MCPTLPTNYSEIFCSSSSGSVGSGMNMATIANPRDRDRTTMSGSSLQSSQTTVFGAAAAATTTVAEVEFNSMPPDATLLPNVEVNSLYELSLILVVVIKLNYDFRFTERRSGTDRCQECIIPTRRRSDFMTVRKIYELTLNLPTILYLPISLFERGARTGTKIMAILLSQIFLVLLSTSYL